MSKIRIFYIIFNKNDIKHNFFIFGRQENQFSPVCSVLTELRLIKYLTLSKHEITRSIFRYLMQKP